MPARLFFRAAAVLLLGVTAACSAPKPPEGPAGLRPFRTLTQAPDGGHPLLSAWAGGAAPRPYDVIVLGDIEFAPEAGLTALEAEKWKGYIREWLLYDFRTSGAFEVATADPYFRRTASWGRRVLSLRVRVTQFWTGWGLLRFYVGFGLGSAQFAWEGEGIDEATGAPVVQFFDVRKEAGSPCFGLNWKVVKANHVTLIGLRKMTQNLSSFLGAGIAPRRAPPAVGLK